MKRISGLRWWIVALISLGTILNYLARNSLGVLAPQLKLSLHFSTAQYSYVVAAFQLAYTVMQPVCGFVIDRIGLRLGVALFALVWAGANMLHAFAGGWPSLAFFRGLLGVGESAAVPSGIKAVSEWFPAKERSVAVGYFNTGTSLGALIAPPVVVFLALRYDWRAAFVVTGALGAAWAALWYIAYRPPTEHPLLGEAERGYILDGQPPASTARTPIAVILRQRAFWAIAIPRFLSEPAWQTFSFWIPLYLTAERGMNLKGVAMFAWLPFLAADIGGLAGGYLSPVLIARFGVRLIPSRIAGIALGAVLMIGPGLVGLAAGPGWAIGLFCIGGFAHQMISTLINTLSADVFPASSVATANGLVGMAGWTGGLIFSLIVGALADKIGYSPLFACLAVFDLIGAAVLIVLIRGVDTGPCEGARMTRSIANPPLFHLAERDGPRLTLRDDRGAAAHIFVLEADIFRVFVLPDGAPVMPRTWAIAPGQEDVAQDGRDRFDVSGFSRPDYALEQAPDRLIVTTSTLRLTVTLKGFFCRWEMSVGGAWRPVAKDRPTQAYNFGWWDQKVSHYLVLRETERFFGLGERSGAMDRAGRRFALSNIDAMGYSAKTSDPLYKHIPFYITLTGEPAAAFGIFYDTLADCGFDFGAARSNYHGRFRGFTADDGDLDYYVIAGPQVAEVTRRFTWLTGRPAFLPKWGLGYSGSTMSYTDAPDAQARMDEFIEGCRRHDILCDSFHLSSGYTSIGARRYVFHWNRDKFPDPAAFVRDYREAGVRLCANIKPCLLDDHPLFEEARARGLLIADAAGEPYWVQFWDGLGAYLDFTNPATLDWWKAHVTDDLLSFGIAATWNDNNEFEIPSSDARAAMFGSEISAAVAKPLQTLLMTRASREAQRAHAPGQRPFLVSRAGGAGMQRYVQTWSGDNSTSWETLRYNIRMGLGLALSGVSNSGHDIGGFSGPAPDAELLVRWVQAGVFMPRFSIHSWNDDGTANEPWMHEAATQTVRGLIALRYRLLPYLYDLTWRHHSAFEPIVRPTFLEFPTDPECLAENDELMLGPSLLTAPVFEPGATTRTLYLPAGPVWRDFWSGERFEGGQTVTVPAPLDQPVLLVREGAAIPLNIAAQHFGKRGDERAFAVFPPPVGKAQGRCFEDDGETEAWRNGDYGFWSIEVDCAADKLTIACVRDGPTPPVADTLTVLLPLTERRSVEAVAGQVLNDRVEAGWRAIVMASIPAPSSPGLSR